MGRPTGTLHVDDRGGTVRIESLSRFLEPHGTGDEAIFDIAGRFDSEPLIRPEATYVAVAVNGVVRAVTHTWANEPLGWQATLPPPVWKDGRNDLEVFVIEGTEGQPLLHRCELLPGAQ